MDGLEAASDRLRAKPRPASDGRRQVGLAHDRRGAVGVQTWTLVVLQLEQLYQSGRLRRGRRDPELAVQVGEHDPDRGRTQEIQAPAGEGSEEVDHVEVVDKCVCELDERFGQLLLPGHVSPAQSGPGHGADGFVSAVLR